MTAAPEIIDRLITCVAATKTFNLAGAHVGACIVSNPELKKKLDARIGASGLGSYNGFGMIATVIDRLHGVAGNPLGEHDAFHRRHVRQLVVRPAHGDHVADGRDAGHARPEHLHRRRRSRDPS